MSFKKGGVQKFICDEVHNSGSNVPVPFVHCSAHNLDIVINEAAEATVPGKTFFWNFAYIFFLLRFQFKPRCRTCSY